MLRLIQISKQYNLLGTFKICFRLLILVKTGSRLAIIMIAVTFILTHAATSETSVTFSNYHFNSNYRDLGKIHTGPAPVAASGRLMAAAVLLTAS